MRLDLNGIFKDKMVFQWGTEIRVFGKSSGNCEVCVEIFEGDRLISEAKTKTEDNRFLALLPPIDSPGGPFEFRIRSLAGGDKDWMPEAVIRECYAGEVWLAAGQSNMEYPLVRSEFAKYTIENVPETDIHFYQVPVSGFMDDAQEQAEHDSEWVTIDRETCRNMSGIAFYFARELESRIDCKIGIIGCYLGDTSISCWLSADKLMTTPEGRRFKEDFDNAASGLSDDEFDELLTEYKDDIEDYESKVSALLDKNPYATYLYVQEQFGELKARPPVGYKAIRHPGAMFECMIKRISPFSLRGVIYYQGESDCDEHAPLYGQVFASLISEWREVFMCPDLPFVFCQLPMYISKERRFMNYDDYSWAKLREQQQIVAIDVKNTYMAVIADCGEFDNIHPANKKTPGHRLAAMALKYVYGFKHIPALAPYIIDARRGDGVEISFGGDFLLLNLTTGYDSEDTGFEIAGDDGEFYRASATVDFDGRTVLLNCPKVAFPVKVRYGYFSYGATPLYADNGLAAAPFSVNVEKSLGGA